MTKKPQTPTTPDKNRFITEANLRRHGLDRFQASSRRAAERLARKPITNDPDEENTI